MHYDIVQSAIDLKLEDVLESIYEIFKIKFNDLYINQDKYRSVSINNEEIRFNEMTNGQIVHIGFKQGLDYKIEVIDSNSAMLDKTYDYNLYYVIDNNPVIKSGFVLIASNEVLTHSIRLEEK